MHASRHTQSITHTETPALAIFLHSRTDDMKKWPNDHTAVMPHMTVQFILLFPQRCRLVTHSGPLLLDAARPNMSWVNRKMLFHLHTAGHILEVSGSFAKEHDLSTVLNSFLSSLTSREEEKSIAA